MAEKSILFATEAQQVDDGTGLSEVMTEKHLIFRSNDLLFGVSAECVVEIITSFSITHLPMVPDYVSGIINLRGQIIPIIDIRLLLNKSAQEDCCIIVLEVDGSQLGILVDSVVQMVDIPAESILPMPTQNTQKLISGMCSLPNDCGTAMILDCSMLLQHC